MQGTYTQCTKQKCPGVVSIRNLYAEICRKRKWEKVSMRTDSFPLKDKGALRGANKR